MKSRKRVLKAINFEKTDRIPTDLGGFLCTGINAFAYPGLVRSLNLESRLPTVYSPEWMLALPDLDVLDALNCDVVTVYQDITNAFRKNGDWKLYDFNGRLPSLVRSPEVFNVLEDGTVRMDNFKLKMPPSCHYFCPEDNIHNFSLAKEIPIPDIEKIKKDLEANRLTKEEIKKTKSFVKKVRESTDRAIAFTNVKGCAGIACSAFTGIAAFPILCMTQEDIVIELHETVTRNTVEQIGLLLSEIGPYIDIYFLNGDDWGTQANTIMPPDVFKKLFMPYYKRMNDTIHNTAPDVKSFLHSCGAIYDVIDLIIESGFDVLNPVQWTAGSHSYKEWKDKCHNRIALWGGGVDSQKTLPYGSPEEVANQVSEVTSYLSRDSGYIFSPLQNILAEVPGENVVAMYRALEDVAA